MFHQVVDLVSGHGGVEGEGDFAGGEGFGLGELVGAWEVFAVVAEGVDGGIVDAGLDAVGFHVVLEGGAAVSLGEEDGRYVSSGDAGVASEGYDDFGGEVGAVMGDDFAAALVVGGEFFELFDAQGGADFVDAVVVSQLNDVVGVGVAGVAVVGEGGHAVGAQEFESGGDFVGVGGEHAAFSRSQVFVGEEGEAADIAPGAEGFAFQGCSRCVGCIFDDGEVVLAGNLEDGGHVTGVAGVVHDDDGFGARGDGCLDGCGGDGEVVGAGDVCEYDAGAGVEDGVGGGDEGERGDDDFIAGADAEGDAGKVEGFGGVGDGEAVGGGGEVGEGLFEVVRHVSHC